MKIPPRFAHHLLVHLDGAFDRLQARRFRDGRWRGRLMIVPYLGFGWSHSVYLKGRVLIDRGILPAGEHDPAWRNVLNMYRRMLSQEVPGAQVLARCAGAEVTVLAGEEGFFEVRLELAETLPDASRGELLPPQPAWQPVELQLLWPQSLAPANAGASAPATDVQGQAQEQASQGQAPVSHMQGPAQPAVSAAGQALIIHPQAQYGVISDIDDTVLVTHAANPLRMGPTMLFKNARTRLAFPGVAAFYQALQAGGATGKAPNPLFYVSSSPWNFYDLLVHFLELHGIPLGPMIALRDWGITQNERLPIDNQAHKLRGIGQILEMLPHLAFLLIGDSGQEDPEIYTEVARRFPGRILGVYIRAVNCNPARLEQIRALGQQVQALGSTFLLTAETAEMARHAASQGWIAA